MGRARKHTKMRMPVIQDYSPWDMERYMRIGPAAAYGDYTELAYACNWLRKDGRVGSCKKSRDGAFLEAPLSITSKDEGAIKLLREDFRKCISPATHLAIMDWLDLAGMCLVQVKRDAENLPVLEVWDLQFLSNLHGEGYKIEVAAGEGKLMATIKITANMGEDWLLFVATDGNSPWSEAGWRTLMPYVVGKVDAFVDWMRNSMHQSMTPLLIETAGDTFEGKEEFFEDLDDIGQMPYLEKPMGVTVERAESADSDYRTCQELIRDLDLQIGEYRIGQATTTRLDQGSYNAVEVLIEKISTKIANRDLSLCAGALNKLWVPLWKAARNIAADIMLGWTVKSEKDAALRAQTFLNAAQAAEKLQLNPLMSSRIDWDRFVRETGLPHIADRNEVTT